MNLRPLFLMTLVSTAAVAAGEEVKLSALSQAPAPVQMAIVTQVGGGSLEEIDRSTEGGDITFDVTFMDKSGAEHGFTVGADGALLSTEVGFADTPAAVQKTIRAQATGAELDGIDKSVGNGETTYDVEVKMQGSPQEFTVDADGTLLSKAVELGNTPAAVQKTIQTEASGFQVQSIEENLDDADVSYDVEAAGVGREKDFTVDNDGTLSSEEVARTETPAAVQTVVSKQVADGTVKSIDENFDPDGNTFDVEAMTKGGAPLSFTVTAGGALFSEEVTLDQVPGAARKTIQDQVGGGNLIRIDQALVEKKKKVLPYEVEARKDGKAFDFSVGPKGRFLGVDQ